MGDKDLGSGSLCFDTKLLYYKRDKLSEFVLLFLILIFLNSCIFAEQQGYTNVEPTDEVSWNFCRFDRSKR